jgi:hypothetical protein
VTPFFVLFALDHTQQGHTFAQIVKIPSRMVFLLFVHDHSHLIPSLMSMTFPLPAWTVFSGNKAGRLLFSDRTGILGEPSK